MSSEIAAVCEPDDSDAQAWDAAGEARAQPSAGRDLQIPDRHGEDIDWARPFAMRQIEMLGELAELGLGVARAIERQASDPSAAPAGEGAAFKGDPALAFARVSRAVRLTLMLQSKLIEALKAAGTADSEAEEEARRTTPEYRRKVRVERIVERLAEAERPGAEDEVTDLLKEAAERLDDEDLYGDLLDRPVSEIVGRLCADLGLDPDWAELAKELWAVRELESGEVGWPLARLAVSASSPVSGSEAGGLANRIRFASTPGGPDGAFLSDTG